MGPAGSEHVGLSPSFHFQPAVGLWTQQVSSVETQAALVPFQLVVHLEFCRSHKQLGSLQILVEVTRWSGSCSNNSCWKSPLAYPESIHSPHPLSQRVDQEFDVAVERFLEGVRSEYISEDCWESRRLSDEELEHRWWVIYTVYLEWLHCTSFPAG